MILQKEIIKEESFKIEEVLKLFIDMAFSELNGVKCSETTISRKFLSTFNRSYDSINILTENKVISVYVKVSVTFGKNIPQICHELQLLLKNNIETFTSYFVSEVNVLVDQIITKE